MVRIGGSHPPDPGSNPVVVAHPFFWGIRTCGLVGHDARFTRERSRVRITARVRTKVFASYIHALALSLFNIDLFFVWRVPLQATNTVKSHERASPR